MALYQNTDYLAKSDHLAFFVLHQPGDDAPNPGIYRCVACGDEIGIAKGHKLPPQNHHQHDPNLGDIKWQLLVCAVSRE